jgi:hypothetical protein
LIAIVNQGRALNHQSSLSGSDLLAAIYKASSADFHDITSGSNGYRAGTGYDYASGRGTPIANKLIPDLVATIASSSARTSGSTGTVSSHRLGTRLTIADNDPSIANAVTSGQTTTPRLQNAQTATIANVAPTLPPLNTVQSGASSIAIALSGGSDQTSDNLENTEPAVMPASFEDNSQAPAGPTGSVSEPSEVRRIKKDAVDGFFAAPVLVADELSSSAETSVSKNESEPAPLAEWNVGVVGFLAFVGGNWAVKSAREEEKRPAMQR